MSSQGPRQLYALPRLEELRAMLEGMLPGLPGVVYRCRNNEAWSMLDLEESVRDLTGYGPEELVGDAVTSYAELIHPGDRDRVRDEVVRALEAGVPFRTLYRIRARGGEEKWVWEHGRAARGPGDEIIGFIQDVTGWRREWRRLAEATRLMEQTLAGLDEAVVVIDTSGEGRGILNVNPAAEEIFGYSRSELVGSTTERLHVGREAFERFAAELEPILVRDGVVHASFPMRRKDGTEFEAEQTVSLLDPEQGLSGGAVSVIRDVSERRALERRLRQTQKMEAVGRLAGGIAHDFNNLLTVIRAHSEFLLAELRPGDPLGEEAEAIQSAADRAAQLTGQLLAMSREQVLKPRVVDVNDVVRSVERLLERVMGEGVQVRTELHPDPVPVTVDPSQLEQALMNLAVNARDAMPGGGVLTLATAPEGGHGPGPHESPWIRITVADTGIGMTAETAARVFEPFFTTKEAGGGTGLGLATTYGFVTQSGGTIQVDSEPGRGTEFVLRFPRAAEPVDGSRGDP